MALSCHTDDLAEAAKCFCIPDALLDIVDIYLLCTWANGGVAPNVGIMLGNPDKDFAFGVPVTDVALGAP